MLNLTGYIVRETVAFVAFVREADAAQSGIRPFWVPKSKILIRHEQDRAGVKIVTAQDGERIGVPTVLIIDEAFAVKVRILATASARA
jgi:hypothetical protein